MLSPPDQHPASPHAEAPLGGPGPILRRGPRPLLLHLMLAWMKSTSSIAALPDWRNGWASWSELATAAGADCDGRAGKADIGAAFARALDQAMRHDSALVAGIAAYRRHPGRREVTEPLVIWQEGESRLLDYAPAGGGRPVVFVPSLINRGYILDLTIQRSMLRYLAARGVRPLLLEWGWPGPVERSFTLTDYVAGRLERALLSIGAPVVLTGYCMGGLLAAAAAQRRPDLVSGLALLATPWDFRCHDPEQADALARLLPLLQPILDFGGALPIDALQAIFAMLDPEAVAAKFRAFGTWDQASAKAAFFVALEDWANDGVPLAAPVARECLGGWYAKNTALTGQWRIAGMSVRPDTLRIPCLVAIPGRDRIVPPESALALARLLDGATVISPAAGHIGMVAGSVAEAQLWRPFAEWLAALSSGSIAAP